MIFIFIVSSFLGIALSLAVRKLASRWHIVDFPAKDRKLHAKPVPLLGGLAPYAAFFAVIFVLFYLKILPANLFAPLKWMFLSSTIIMLGGFLDDKYVLPPKIQIIFPLAAIALTLWGGVRVHLITNPQGGILYLGPAVSLAVSFFWLFAITYTTKILDGLDGLVGGTVALGALAIFLFTTLSNFKEISMAHISIALAGSFLGFLFLNFYPTPLRQGFAGQAKLFLGEGGSLFAGFIFGALAIMTGAKIAVSLMVFSLPLIDLIAVVLKRIIRNKPVFAGDRLHLHYILVDRGWKPRNVVFVYWGLAAVLGFASIFLPSSAKIITLAAILTIFFLVDMFGFKEK
ncbi:MAG: MraY family glycosyltransferase [bacterium]